MTIFFDLDGTIVDISEKYNQTFNRLRKRFRLAEIDYWTIRKSTKSFRETISLLGVEDAQQEDFFLAWQNIIETKFALSFDRLLLDTSQFLLERGANHKIVLCTSRKDRQNLFWQLGELGLVDFFDEVINCPSEEKGYFVSKWLKENNENCEIPLFVGDTEADMLVSKSCKIQGIGVLSGLSNRESLMESGASLILDSVKDLGV
jgi:phosphoglycolate phosphatase-like HAD superfamily hydrolase